MDKPTTQNQAYAIRHRLPVRKPVAKIDMEPPKVITTIAPIIIAPKQVETLVKDTLKAASFDEDDELVVIEKEPVETQTRTKYQQQLEQLVKNCNLTSDTMAHEYGYSQQFVINKGNYRIVSIETEKPIKKDDLIFISLISDDDSVILGGIGEYLLPYQENDKTFNVVVENHSETRTIRLNYHIVSQK